MLTNKILVPVGFSEQSLAALKQACLIAKIKKSEVYTHIIKKGETSKSFSTYKEILAKLVKLRISRTDMIIAFGGGVVGDIAGFVASSYLRGINYIQIPTTLLSQVDSSVGGKTAINIPEGKNLVGAFYNPKLVLISTKFLQTLTDKEYKSGLGEVIKYALIDNKKLIMSLENIKIYAIGNPIIQVNEKTQNVSIQIENPNENILFVGPGKLKNWKFDIHSTKIEKEITSNELTGCLSFYDVEFHKVSISSTNLSSRSPVPLPLIADIANNVSKPRL